MGLGGKKYLNIISPLSRIRENKILELKIGDETKENIEMNDDDDDLESIQFGRGQKFSKKKKYKYKYMYFSFSLATSIVERDIWIKIRRKEFLREFSNSFTKSKRTIESFLFHAFQDFQKRGGEKNEEERKDRRAQFVAAFHGYRVARRKLDNNVSPSGLAFFI